MPNLTDRIHDALSGSRFPADRNDLIVTLADRREEAALIDAVTALPEGTYASLQDVTTWLEAAQDRGDDRGAPTDSAI